MQCESDQHLIPQSIVMPRRWITELTVRGVSESGFLPVDCARHRQHQMVFRIQGKDQAGYGRFLVPS